MDTFTAIFLGIVQGITEFIPISSSGHLVLLSNLFGIEEGAITFNIFVHFGTALAVILVYSKEIKEIVLFKREQRKLTLLLFFGILPTAIIGLLFEEEIKAFFSSSLMVGFMLLITGTILFFGEKLSRERKGLAEMGIGDALLIGLAQSFAVFPGISRSGSTIVMALLVGLRRDLAARYSFLLSVPVILGATLIESRALLNQEVFVGITALPLIMGTIFSIITGVLAINVLLVVLRKRRLDYFAFYCWTIGVIVILFNL